MVDRRGKFYYVVVVLVAGRVGWAVWEFVFRNYGAGTTPVLLNASPQAAAVAGIAWLVTTLVLALVGFLLVRTVRGVAA